MSLSFEHISNKRYLKKKKINDIKKAYENHMLLKKNIFVICREGTAEAGIGHGPLPFV
jgi:hypothetical protein